MSPTVIQVPLEVPPEIMEGIQRGIYNLFGGVVRNLDGTIVKLLDDASTADAVEHVATAVQKAVKNSSAQLKNPWVIGVTLVGTVVVAAVAVAVVRGKKKASTQVASSDEHADEPAVPASIIGYRSSLRAYLDAARSGTLSTVIISDLLDATDAIKLSSDADEVTVDFEAEESQALVSMVVGYTRSLADANSLDLNDLLPPSDTDGTLGELLRYLKAQRTIFAQAD